MKTIFKIFSLMIVVILAVTLVACTNNGSGSDYTQDIERPSFDGAKSLVIYFS